MESRLVQFYHLLPERFRLAAFEARSRWQMHRATGGQLKSLARDVSSLGSPLVAYHIGASGLPDRTQQYLVCRGAMEIIGFEPNAGEAAKALATGYMKRIIPVAVGSTKETRTLYLTREPSCSSLFRPNREILARSHCRPEAFDVVGEAEISLVRLDEVVVAENLPKPDMLQVDTQGFDLEVIRGAGSLIEDVLVIDVEAHSRPLYDGQPLISDIDEFLKSRGFSQVRRRMSTDAFHGEFVEGDYTYVNSNRAGARLNAAVAAARLRYTFADSKAKK